MNNSIESYDMSGELFSSMQSLILDQQQSRSAPMLSSLEESESVSYDAMFEDYDAEEDGDAFTSEQEQEEENDDAKSETFPGEMIFLVSRPFAVPYDIRNCVVEVYISRDYDEVIYLKCLYPTAGGTVLAERSLHVDHVHDILEQGRTAKKVASNDDLMGTSPASLGLTPPCSHAMLLYLTSHPG